MSSVPVAAQGLAGAYLSARAASASGDFESASRYFSRAMIEDPGNPALMENAIIAEVSLGNFDRAAQIADKLEATGAQSQIAHLASVSALAKAEDYDALLARLNEDGGIGPLVDGLLRAWTLVGQGKMSDALTELDTVAQTNGLAGFAMYHKALAMASVGDFEGAEAIFAADASGSLSGSRRGALARIEILSQLGRVDEARALMDSSFRSELDPSLKQIAADLEAGEALPFSHIRSARDGMAEVFFTIAGALNQEAESSYTLLYSRVTEYLRPDHVDAILMNAGLLDEMGQYDLAVATYRKVPRDDPSFHVAELGRAESLRDAGKDEAAIEVLEQLARDYPDQPFVHSTLGDVMRQREDFQAAIAPYDRAIALYEEMDAPQWFAYYARSICLERVGDWDKAKAGFERALTLNPEQPQVLNYLGYSMVEKHEDLDRALGLIERAVIARPDSGYIVDSLGWVNYRLGRYDEAIVHMERAAELMPVDPVVNDHLGDVLWAVGRQREAEFQWRRALSFITDSTNLEEVDPLRIRRKLEVGLDVVLEEEGAPPLQMADDI
nr:tetratricopeptide repeat protein [Mesobacterium pallidum]